MRPPVATILRACSSLLLAALALPATARAQDAPVEHALQVHLDAATHTVTVHDRVTLPDDLARAGAEFTLHPVAWIGRSEPQLTSLGTDDDGEARYALAAAPADGVLELEYSGVFDFALSDLKEEYTRGFRETLGWLGEDGVYLSGESDWLAEFDGRMLRFELTVQQPDGWHVISQGAGTSRDADGLARWASEGLMEQVYLTGGPLQVRRDSAGAVQAAVYMRDMDEALARKYLDATARYVEMYRRLIGPYPYGKFALVENFWETGYGMPSFTLLGPQVIRFPFILHSSYPHEILHNWWGNSVFVDYATGNWCEGLTAYMADHLIAEQRGTGDVYRRNTLAKYRDYVKEGRDFPLAEFRSRHSAATEAVGYGKALMLFHMLRRSLGDADFTRGLVDFYRAQRGRRAGFDDLRAAWEGASGAELGDTFAQWVERTGAPQLALADVDARPISNGWLLTGTLRQEQAGEAFALDVPVSVLTREGLQTFQLASDAREVGFTFALGVEPVSLEVDPHFDLFRVLDPRETPPSIGQLFGSPEVLAVLPADDDGLYRDLMEGWRSDEHAIELVSERDLDALPADRAVWVLGRHNRFAAGMLGDGDVVKPDDPEGTADTADSGDTARLGADAVPFADHSLVVVRRHPGNLDLAVGWIVVEPAAAAAGMGRKLPHYGKYSYLAFEGDEPVNVVKGEWPVSGSPLMRHFGAHDGPGRAGFETPRAALAELPPVFSEGALAAHVEWLADPARDGRGVGTPGLRAAADYIAAAFERAGLQPGGDDGGWFQTFELPGPDGLPTTARNVVGVLPGSDPAWGDQSFVLSAHYDHLGRGWPDARAEFDGQLHPGADDNASGVAVLIELARNLAAEGGGRRNLVVAAFSAEEAGRVGSRHYAAHPRFPLEQLNGVINMDTVGRLSDGKLFIHGTGTADEWQHIFRGCGFVTGIASTNVPGLAEGSDQQSFIERGIPAVQIFTGTNADYHRPSDTADKVRASDLVTVATFVKEAVGYMLEREEPLTNRIEPAGSASAGQSAGAASRPAAAGAQSGRSVSFGSIPDMAWQGQGVRLDGVTPGSPAEQAGLREGDVLLAVDDAPIGTLRDFSNVLKALAPGDVVSATIERDGERLQVDVTLVAR